MAAAVSTQMSTAPLPQPDPLVAPLGWSGGTKPTGAMLAAAGPGWSQAHCMGHGQWCADFWGAPSTNPATVPLRQRGATNALSPAGRLCTEVGAVWGSTGTPFLQAQPWGMGSAARQWWPMSPRPSQPGQDSCGVGLPCPSPGPQPCECQGCLKRLKMPKPGADTAAMTGPTSSWTQVPMLMQLLSEVSSAGDTLWAQGQHHCRCSMGTPWQCTAFTQLPQHHRFSACWGPRMVGAQPGTLHTAEQHVTTSPWWTNSSQGCSSRSLQHSAPCISFRSAPPAVNGLCASPLGASSSMGAIAIPAHRRHPGHSQHHGDMFLP